MDDQRLTPYDRERLQLEAIARWEQATPRERHRRRLAAQARMLETPIEPRRVRRDDLHTSAIRPLSHHGQRAAARLL
jgi:hypothetical protein